MATIQFWKWLAAALAILNLCTLGFLWWNRPPGPPPHGKQGVRALIASLHFDPAQQARADTLRNEHRAAMADFVQKSSALRKSLYQLSTVNTPDTLSIHQLIDQLATEQKRMEQMTFDHFRQVRALCTPEQQQRFDQGISDAVSVMLHAPPRR